MHSKFIVLSIIEVSYLTLSFALAMAYGQWSYEGELIRTLARVVCVLMYGWFYLKYFYHPGSSGSNVSVLRPGFLVGISLLLGFAIIDSNAINESSQWQRVFVISGIAAGFREELLYRGMVQNTLQDRFGNLTGLMLASLLFTLSHVQYIYYGQLNGLLLIACAGIIFGCVYIYSRNIICTGLVHGLYDALLSVDYKAYKIRGDLELPLLAAITLVFIILVRKQLTGNHKNRIHTI